MGVGLVTTLARLVYRQGETMFLLARYTVAAAVFLSASAATAVEDATLSADLPAVSMLPA